MRKATLVPTHRIVSLRSTIDGEVLRVTFELPMRLGWFERVRLHIVRSDGFDFNSLSVDLPHLRNEIKKDVAIFEAEIFLANCALYYYYFSYECNGQYTIFKKGDIAEIDTISKQDCFKMSINYQAPDWAKGATMYQIMVDRFYRNPTVKIVPIAGRTINNWNDKPVIGPNENGDWNVDYYGGNLLGVVDKLDYIHDLGATILYLCPILYGQSNHSYDTIDYEQIDPYLGSKEDLATLCSEAHKRGMYVILDGVYNHTGSRSKYFDQYDEHGNNGACNHPDSPYSVFFKKKWRDGELTFSFWWDQLNLPECDTNAPEWIEYITGVGGIIDQLFACGIDGLRLDVADELSDLMIHHIHEAIVRNKPDGFLIGEVWENPMRMNRHYMDDMHSVMNYLLADALIRYFKYCDIPKLDNIMNQILTEYSQDTILTLMNFTSTHDISRAVEIFAGDIVFNPCAKWAWDTDHGNTSDFVKNHSLSQEEYEYGKQVLKSYAVAQAFFPGIFSIFYGDEVGLQGFHNLANRAPYPWGHEDFDLLEFFKSLIAARNSQSFLRTADCSVKEITADHFSFERFNGDEHVLVIVSRSYSTTEVNLPAGFEIIFKNNPECTSEVLPPFGAIVAKKVK